MASSPCEQLCRRRRARPRWQSSQSPLARFAPRCRLDGSTLLAVIVAVLVVLAVLAVLRNSSAMLTRIGLGVLIALALDSVVNALVRRLHVRRGVVVVGVAVAVLGVAVLVVAVLAPRAVAEVRSSRSSSPRRSASSNDSRSSAGGSRIRTSSERAEEWVADLPEQFTDERLEETARSLLSGVVSVAIVTIVAVAVLVDGENLAARFRRLLSPPRRAQADEVGRVVYDTLGRYIGGSLTVAGMMGLFVLAVGLVLGVPLVPLAAVWAMLTDLIPQIGGALGGVVFVALALTESVPTAIIAGALFVAYMTIENHVIQPAVVGRSVDLTAADDDGRGIDRRGRRRHSRRARGHAARRRGQAPDPRGPRPPPAAHCSGVIDSAGRVRLADSPCRLDLGRCRLCGGLAESERRRRRRPRRRRRCCRSLRRPFSPPDGAFSVQFARQPVVVTDPSGTSTSYLNGVDEDTESVIVAAPTAYGAVAESTATGASRCCFSTSPVSRPRCWPTHRPGWARFRPPTSSRASSSTTAGRR